MEEKIILNPTLKQEFQKGFSLFKENIFFHKGKIFFFSILLTLIFFIQNIFVGLFLIGNNSVNLIEKKSDLIIELNSGISEYELQGLQNQIKNFNGVEKIFYSSPENELKNFGENYPTIKNFLDRKNLKNPLPGYLEIYSENIFSTKEILKFLKQEKFSYFINQSEIILNENLNQRIDKIADFVFFISTFFVILFLLLFVFLVFILFSILHISIYSHREEIKKEKFGGEKNFSIKLPYFIEASIFSVLSYLFSIILFFGFIFGIKIFFSEFLENFGKIFGENIFSDFGIYGILMMIFIWILSVISVDWNINRILKK